MVKSPIVARINALLAAKGIPKQQFYKDCSITSASYSLWNTGKTNPSIVSSALTKTIITKFTKNVNKNLVIIVLHFEQLFID